MWILLKDFIIITENNNIISKERDRADYEILQSWANVML